MDINLKVQPQVLSAKAGEMSSEKNIITGLMDEAKAAMASLTNVWKSEASDEYQSRFKQAYNDLDAVLNTVDVYVKDLNNAAGIYSEAEKSAKSVTAGLPTDKVFKI